MALSPTYTLTVDLLTITGQDSPNIPVTVEMLSPRLVYPLGDPPETLYPTVLSAITNAAGVATFQLLPSSIAGPYTIRIGAGFGRSVDMPALDARLSALMHA